MDMFILPKTIRLPIFALLSGMIVQPIEIARAQRMLNKFANGLQNHKDVQEAEGDIVC